MSADYQLRFRQAEGLAKGFVRDKAVVRDGWQFGPGGYATNGTETVDAAAPPANMVKLFATAQGIWAATQQTGVGAKLWLSRDGIEPYVQKWADAVTRLTTSLPLLIDCGRKRLVLVDYCPDIFDETDPDRDWINRINQADVWFSGDDGETWTKLFRTAKASIRHIHGGLYDPRYHRLYLFTGDTFRHSSILWTDDVDSLGANPTLWAERWGLVDPLRSTIDDDWVVARGSGVSGSGDAGQRWRITSAICYGDWIYFGADAITRYGAPVSRVHRVTHEAELVWVHDHVTDPNLAKDGKMVSEGWMTGYGNHRGVLLVNRSQPPSGWNNNHIYCYALQPDGTMRQIAALPAATGAAFTEINPLTGFTVFSVVNSTMVGGINTVVGSIVRLGKYHFRGRHFRGNCFAGGHWVGLGRTVLKGRKSVLRGPSTSRATLRGPTTDRVVLKG